MVSAKKTTDPLWGHPMGGSHPSGVFPGGTKVGASHQAPQLLGSVPERRARQTNGTQSALENEGSPFKWLACGWAHSPQDPVQKRKFEIPLGCT